MLDDAGDLGAQDEEGYHAQGDEGDLAAALDDYRFPRRRGGRGGRGADKEEDERENVVGVGLELFVCVEAVRAVAGVADDLDEVVLLAGREVRGADGLDRRFGAVADFFRIRPLHDLQARENVIVREAVRGEPYQLAVGFVCAVAGRSGAAGHAAPPSG